MFWVKIFPTYCQFFVSEQLGCEFLEFLLRLIEEPPDTDIHDIIPDKFLLVIMSYNLQFPRHSSQNIVLSALGRRSNAKTFTEKILLLLNREGKL